MTPRELDADQLLGALGELHRTQRSDLARLDEQAQELAAREPERAQALEDRLMGELFVEKAAPPSAGKPRSRRVAKLASAAAFSCAMAAAAVLWIRQPVLVSYTLVAPSADATTRSAGHPKSSGVFSLGRTLTFALRPAARYEGALSVLCYAAQERSVVRLQAQVELDPAGGARVVLPADTLSRALREGSWELLFYVAPPSATAVSESQVRDRVCPSDTRCLTYAARFVLPEEL